MRLLNAIAITVSVGVAQGFQFQKPPIGIAQRTDSSLKIPGTGGIPEPASQSRLFVSAADAGGTPAEPWTKPRLHNNPMVRSAAILAVLGLAGSSSAVAGKLPSTASATIHMLSFGTWFGTVFYTTFIAGLTMFRNLPRQTFGKLQSKLFPKYFSLCSAMIVLQLITLGRLSNVAPTAYKALGLSLVMTLLNQFVLEPKSTKVMFERYELENSGDPDARERDTYKKLAASFGKLHGMSSLTNLIALCGAAVHGFYLASALI